MAQVGSDFASIASISEATRCAYETRSILCQPRRSIRSIVWTRRAREKGDLHFAKAGRGGPRRGCTGLAYQVPHVRAGALVSAVVHPSIVFKCRRVVVACNT